MTAGVWLKEAAMQWRRVACLQVGSGIQQQLDNLERY